MKKAIAIVAVIAIALVGLTSYNGTETKKNGSNGSLIAELKSGGTTTVAGTTSDKKRD